MPVSCSKNIIESLTLKSNDNFSDIVKNFYIPASRDCAVDGSVVSQQRVIKATKEQYEQCSSQCGKCDTPECS